MDQFLGQIQTFGFNFPPIGWMHCNGDLLPISGNEALFALIGTIYGGDGQNTFALPDLRGKSMIHQGTGAGLSTFVIGQTSGQENISLLTSNMPAHNHSVTVGVNTSNGEEPVPTKVLAAKSQGFAEDPTGTSVLGGVTESIMGSGSPMYIRNPYVGIYHAIAIEGIFPSRN